MKTKTKTQVPNADWNGYTSTKDRMADESKFDRSERRKAYDQALRESRG